MHWHQHSFILLKTRKALVHTCICLVLFVCQIYTVHFWGLQYCRSRHPYKKLLKHLVHPIKQNKLGTGEFVKHLQRLGKEKGGGEPYQSIFTLRGMPRPNWRCSYHMQAAQHQDFPLTHGGRLERLFSEFPH